MSLRDERFDMRVKKTKALRYIVATFLTMGTVLSVGFLSFSGLWIIYPYTIPAVLAFFFSGVIEGKVFGTSIFKGLARLKLLGLSAKKHLLILELNQLIIFKLKNDSHWLENQCKFLKDYWQQREYYKALKKDPHVDEITLQEAKNKLEKLKNYFYHKACDSNFQSNGYLDERLKEASKHLLKTAKRSVWFLRFFWIISISTGVVSGFVTAFAVQEAITVGLGLSLSATVLSSIIWPVAIFAAIGATFLLYNAIGDIVKNDAISNAFNKTINLFKRTTEESLSAYLLRLLALSVVVVGITSLTIFATLASGGTCWIVMQKGIKLLAPKLPAFVAYCASTILIPINFATDLIYGFSTTLQTIDNCKSIFQAIFEIIKHPINAIKNFCSNIEKELDKLKEKESWGQFFNPFRILAKLVITPLQSLVFIAHLISIGLTTDRFLNVPPEITASVCALAEGASDLSFVTKNDHSHQDDDGHDHGNLLQLPLQVLLSPILIPVGVLYWMVMKCVNAVSFFDAMGQTFNLPLLNMVFFPLLLPSAVWHWVFKKFESNLTFFESIKNSFDIHSHEHREELSSAVPRLSDEWIEEYIIHKLYEAINRLESAFIDKETAREKQEFLRELVKKEGLDFIKKRLKDGIEIDTALYEYEIKLKSSEENIVNGYSNRHINTNAAERNCSILMKSRTFFKSNYEKTTTLRYVEEAFSTFIRATS